MCITNRLAALIYRSVLFVASLFCTLACLQYFGAGFEATMLLYYPVISCTLCTLIYFAETAVTAGSLKINGISGAARFAPHFKGAIILMMLSNMLTYYYWLPETPTALFSSSIVLVMMHFILPVMVFCDWLLFDIKGGFRAADPVIWTLIPFSYYGIVLLAALAGIVYEGGENYPYTLLDPGAAGANWGRVLITVLVIAFFFMLAGYVLVIIDRVSYAIGSSIARRRGVPYPGQKPAVSAAGMPYQGYVTTQVIYTSYPAGTPYQAAPVVQQAPVAYPAQGTPPAPQQTPVFPPQQAGAGQAPGPQAPQ